MWSPCIENIVYCQWGSSWLYCVFWVQEMEGVICIVFHSIVYLISVFDAQTACSSWLKGDGNGYQGLSAKNEWIFLKPRPERIPLSPCWGILRQPLYFLSEQRTIPLQGCTINDHVNIPVSQPTIYFCWAKCIWSLLPPNCMPKLWEEYSLNFENDRLTKHLCSHNILCAGELN